MTDFIGRLPPWHLKRREADREDGFTLIELLMVLLIVGILLAIAIPTFLSATKNASDTAAQANLQSALTGAKAYYTQANQTQSYAGILVSEPNGPSTISQITTGLVYLSGTNSTGLNSVSVSTAGNGLADAVEMTAWAPGTHNCWIVLDLTSAQSSAVLGETQIGTYYAVDPDVPASSCTAGSNTAFTNWVGVAAKTGGFPPG